MSRSKLMKEMDAKEVFKWMAYEMSVDPDKRKNYIIEIQEEKAKFMTDEERAQILKDMINRANGID